MSASLQQSRAKVQLHYRIRQIDLTKQLIMIGDYDVSFQSLIRIVFVFHYFHQGIYFFRLWFFALYGYGSLYYCDVRTVHFGDVVICSISVGLFATFRYAYLHYLYVGLRIIRKQFFVFLWLFAQFLCGYMHYSNVVICILQV